MTSDLKRCILEEALAGKFQSTPEDRHFSRCQLARRGEVFVKAVGTLRAPSACFQRRVAASVERLTQYGHRSGRHHMLKEATP